MSSGSRGLWIIMVWGGGGGGGGGGGNKEGLWYDLVIT